MYAAPQAYQRIDATWAQAWAPSAKPVRSNWITEHVYLPPTFSANPGRFRFDGREYLREVIDAVDDPEVREVVFVAPPQVGKTSATHAIIQSQGEVDSAPLMFAGPDQIYAREQRTILYAACEESPLLRQRVPPENLRNDRWIDLEKCFIFLAWSGSTQRLSGRSCKIVLCSEIDRWTVSVDLARQRTKAFWRSCVFLEGSPIGASERLMPAYDATDRRTFRVPCPHCGRFQEMRFFPHRDGDLAGRGGVAGLQTDKGEWRSPEIAKRSAHYLCEAGCRIESIRKAGMIRRGRWVPEGQDCVDGELTGQPKRPATKRGYRLNALYAPTCSFGDIAEAYLAGRDTPDGMQSFVNDWLALPHRPRGKTPRWEVLGRRLAGGYKRGEIPAWVYFLTAAADVQERSIYWVVRGWGDGCSSASIDWGELKRVMATGDDGEETGEELGSDFRQLDGNILTRRWPVLGANPLGYSELAVCLFGIDSGYRATEVYSYVRDHPGARVQAIYGDPKPIPGVLYRLQKLERNVRTGEVYPEGTTRWGIDTTAYKSDIMGRWSASLRKPGAWWLPGDVLLIGEDYLRQVTNERMEADNTKGKKRTKWSMINPSLGNHYWDDEVYNRALADMVVGQEWDASKWPWAKEALTAARPVTVQPAPAQGSFQPTGFSAR
jgi:phage terminase large subunit GpA-like protein